MDQEREMLVMNLIVDAGSAKSSAMQAIQFAKQRDIAEAKALLETANEELSKAHRVQTGLIQGEAQGNHTTIDLFMVHAQDHIMTAMLARDLAAEIVELYEKIND